MNAPASPSLHRYRFPSEVIRYCVCLHIHFALSYRDIQARMAFREIFVTYETVRSWCNKFGSTLDGSVSCRYGVSDTRWYLEEVPVEFKGESYCLWQAVDQEGHILDILMQQQRDKKAANRFFRQWLT